MLILKSPRWCVWAFVVLMLLPSLLAGQNYVYTNNDINETNGGNTVSGFAVGANGSLSAIVGSPFQTWGKAFTESLTLIRVMRQTVLLLLTFSFMLRTLPATLAVPSPLIPARVS